MIYLFCLWLAHYYRKPSINQYKQTLQRDLLSGKEDIKDENDQMIYQYRLASNLPILLTVSPAMIALLIYFFIVASLGFLILFVYISGRNPYSNIPHYLCLFLIQFLLFFLLSGIIEIYIAAVCKNGKLRKYYDDPLQLPIKVQYREFDITQGKKECALDDLMELGNPSNKD